jgi:ribosomal protein L7/L12
MALRWIIAGLIGAVGVARIVISWRNLARRRHGILPPAGQATMADVERLVRAGERLAAIRVYREIHHVGLAEAKKAVDDLSNAA